MEENTGVGVEELLQRRPVFRVLYILLFCKQSSPLATYASLHKRGFVNVSSYTQNSQLLRRQTLQGGEQVFNQNFVAAPSPFARLLEDRPQRSYKLTDVTLLAAHPSLPLLVEVVGSDIYFVYTKTMAVVNSLGFPKGRSIRQVEFDPLTYKFLVVDGNGGGFVYQFTVDLEKIELVKAMEDARFVHGTFLADSTAVGFITERSEFVVFDLVWKKVRAPLSSDTPLADARMAYVPSLDVIVLVNKAKGAVWTVNPNDFSRRGTVSLSGEEISCFTVHRSLVLAGYPNGTLRVLSLKRMGVLFEQVFEEPDGKRIRVEEVAVCSEFVFVGLGNGTVSIVMKL